MKPVFLRIRRISAHQAMSAIHHGLLHVRLDGGSFSRLKYKPGLANHVANQVGYNQSHELYLKTSQ